MFICLNKKIIYFKFNSPQRLDNQANNKLFDDIIQL